MARFVHEELLSRLGPKRAQSCDCGREHRLRVRDLLVGDDAIDRSAHLLARRHGTPVVYVLSDENTEVAAGTRWKAAARVRRVHERVLAASPRPVPSSELARDLALEVERIAPDVLVSVGSGTLSDLGRKISLDAGVPNWCVATAPSVDAYTSPTAAIRTAGHHRAVPARVSEVVVCDLTVIAQAPRILFLAGLGDLVAKFVAHLDWVLAHRVAGEPFCATLAAFALDSARQALDAARSLDNGPLASRLLVDAALTSGLAMQAFGNSRPAASAEHTIAHFWDALAGSRDRAAAFHGIEVGLATRLVLPGYLYFWHLASAMEWDVAQRLAAFDEEPRWDAGWDEGLRPLEARIAEENRERTFDGTVLGERLAVFRREREGLAALAAPLLSELAAAVQLLDQLGFPRSASALGLDRKQSLLPVRYARLLRHRYTTFDLAYELGHESALFGPIEAVWEA